MFYRAIAHHQLVQPTQADAALAQLLQRQDDLPTRYQKLADLMRQDLPGSKTNRSTTFRGAWTTFAAGWLKADRASTCRASKTASSNRSTS